MIPSLNITAWSKNAPWAEQRQIEQDLIISRAIVEIFRDPLLGRELRFRGGTALNKLHFPKPLRYSEDIDLVRTTAGPIGPVLDQLRAVLQPWLGRAKFVQSDVAPKLRFRVEAEDGSVLRLKVEINTREIEAYAGAAFLPYRVENPWFAGEADIATFTPEEMLATKLRALLQRDKGRDLLDLAHGLAVMADVDPARVAGYLGRYLERAGQRISRAEAEERMFGKLSRPGFLADIRPLLAVEEAERLTEGAMTAAFEAVFSQLIVRFPGASWNRSDEMAERFGIGLDLADKG